MTQPEVGAPGGERVRAGDCCCCYFITRDVETCRHEGHVIFICLSRDAKKEGWWGVRFVLTICKARGCLRPWIAMVAAYALALQVLLSGIAGAHAMAGAASGPDALFVICHGSGDAPADSQNVPDTPRPASPCLLCTLTKAPCAIIDVVAASTVAPRTEGRIIEFDSPTGRYQRGPPAGAAIFG
jgi:hypothetical protein